MGFVAGMLVHTDKGLVPIEQIQVGDMVLSKFVNGESEQRYSPVVKAFKSKDKHIYRLTYITQKTSALDLGLLSYLFVMEGHPIWVKANQSWVSVSVLEGGEELELADGTAAYAIYVEQVAPAREGIGRCDGYNGAEMYIDFRCKVPEISYSIDEEGYTDYKNVSLSSVTTQFGDYIYYGSYPDGIRDYSNHPRVNAIFGEFSSSELGGASYPFTCPVYSLVVEESRGYYVDKDGLLVNSD